MRLADRSARRLLRRCRVARIATLSGTGRPSVNPLYSTTSHGRILLGTSTWTLAARNIAADPRVCLLFEAEPGPAPQVLRVTGHAEIRTDRRTIVTFARGCARRYVLTPGALRDAAAHRRLHGSAPPTTRRAPNAAPPA